MANTLHTKAHLLLLEYTFEDCPWHILLSRPATYQLESWTVLPSLRPSWVAWTSQSTFSSCSSFQVPSDSAPARLSQSRYPVWNQSWRNVLQDGLGVPWHAFDGWSFCDTKTVQDAKAIKRCVSKSRLRVINPTYAYKPY